MENTKEKIEVIQYKTSGTCCKTMRIEIINNVIKDAEFIGGCAGNLIGIQNLIKGMNVEEVIKRFGGIKCGDKPTSCPDQLAICLKQYKLEKNLSVA